MEKPHRTPGVRTVLAMALTLAAGTTAARAQDARLAPSWVPMLEGCLAYAETGRRAVFDGWAIAAAGGGLCTGDPACEGGLCTGDPACEGDEMTFVTPGPETGAVTVRVGTADWVGATYHGRDPVDRTVGPAPAHAFCSSAEQVRHRTADIDAVHRDWIDHALATGRLAEAAGFVSRTAGPYLGCGYDGRPFLIEFSLARPGRAVLRLNYPTRFVAREGALTCAGLSS